MRTITKIVLSTPINDVELVEAYPDAFTKIEFNDYALNTDKYEISDWRKVVHTKLRFYLDGKLIPYIRTLRDYSNVKWYWDICVAKREATDVFTLYSPIEVINTYYPEHMEEHNRFMRIIGVSDTEIIIKDLNMESFAVV